MNAENPTYHRPDKNWCDFAADLAAGELVKEKLIDEAQFPLAKETISFQLWVLLMSDCRPIPEENQTETLPKRRVR